MSASFQTLGDPHLGRSFIHGVPLTRRGEREHLVWSQFEAHVSSPTADIHVCVGDLFDKAIVPYNTIVRAAEIYREAANDNPDVKFVVLKGNHDWMRDLTSVSAFDIFAKIVEGTKNIHVVDNWFKIDDLAFFAWQPVMSASEMVQRAGSAKVAFGHWDVKDFNNGNINLIPTKELAGVGVETAYTGHIHKPETFTRDDVEVFVTGSMQPYAHGEEENTDLYVTLTLEQLAQTNLNLANRCVRIVLSPGENLGEEIDCLQLTIKRDGSVDEPLAAVSLGDFDMDAMFRKSFAEAGVGEAIAGQLMAAYHSKRLHDGV